jgi:hypothetical protein
LKSRARSMLDKSIHAMLAAIEIYNKPSFRYREEAFAILCINAWELLLKSRTLEINKNHLSSIIQYERRKKADGSLTEKWFRKKNRSGNHLSIGLFVAYDNLVNIHGDSINPTVRKNLEALVEIRDNAIHFMNKGFQIKKKVHEMGTANLKNYFTLIKRWFGSDFSQYNLFLMPIAFLDDVSSIEGLQLGKAEQNLLKYMDQLEAGIEDNISNDFNLSLDIEVKFKKVRTQEATPVVVDPTSPDAVLISLSEEDIREKYPWDYKMLIHRLRQRYSNFKQNARFYQIKKELEDDDRYCKARYLDPGNTNGTVKKFYNPNICKEFDKHYSRQLTSNFSTE